MVDHLHVPERGREGRAVLQRSGSDERPERGDERGLLGAPGETDDGVTTLDQGGSQVAADEPGGSGDERLHIVS